MKIVVASADSELSASIGFSLQQAGHDVEATQDASPMLALFKRDAIHFVLLDMNLAAPGAIELCRTIRRISSAPIMMLAARDSEDDLVAALEAGADDYLRKPFSPRALLARVRALTRRAQPLVAKAIRVGALQLDLEQHRLRIGATTEIYLTPLELKALQMLVSTPGRTIPSERLLLHLWGHEGERERHTLKQLVYRLRSKLEACGAAGLLQTTPGSGYRISAE